jgi:L-iditol 2-dehydrogenase
MTSKAALLLKKQKFVIEEIKLPDCRDDEALVRIRAIGVCGSDAHYFKNGRIGDQIVPDKFIIGHEAAGEVVEVGKKVKNVKAGDRVAIDPGISCGVCEFCITGRPNLCPDVKFLGTPPIVGAYREHIVMPARNLVKLPEGVGFEEGALSEPLAIGIYGVRLAGFMAGSDAAILGAGPIGLSVLFACKSAGARRIFVTELIGERVAMAKKLGADFVYLAHKTDIVKMIMKETCNKGVDFAFECAGEQETISRMIEVAKIGGNAVIFGIPEADTIFFDPHVARRKQLPILSVRRSAFTTEIALWMLAKREIPFASIITHRFPLEKIQEALELVSERRDGVIKAMILP